MVRDIAGGVDVLGAGPALFVDQNTVILRDAVPGDGRDHGFNPDASHGEVTRHAMPPAVLTPVSRSAFERGNLISASSSTPCPR